MKPPKIVKAPEGCEIYFTPGKEYQVKKIGETPTIRYGYGFEISGDDGLIKYCLEKECSHLEEQDWIIVSRQD